MSEQRPNKQQLKRPWTDADDAVLLNFAATVSAVRIAVRLKRTKNAVIDRANKLGVSFPRTSRRGRPRLARNNGQTQVAHQTGRPI